MRRRLIITRRRQTAKGDTLSKTKVQLNDEEPQNTALPYVPNGGPEFDTETIEKVKDWRLNSFTQGKQLFLIYILYLNPLNFQTAKLS